VPPSDITADQVLNALGDPTRRAIFERLAQGPLSVSALAEPLAITLTAVAQHLQVLERCGLAATEKVGRVRTCRVATAGLDVLERWVRKQRPLLERQLDNLAAILGERDG
jgi:DNA-binding transcriptional ArsR family regulator